MTPYRINIPLTLEERDALSVVASKNCRNPREQARYILRMALIGNAGNDPPEQAVGKHSGAAKVSEAHGAAVSTL